MLDSTFLGLNRLTTTPLGLDFIPVGEEQHDLLFLRQFFESDKGEKLLEVIRSDGFKKAVEALGGYDARRAGEILYRQ